MGTGTRSLSKPCDDHRVRGPLSAPVHAMWYHQSGTGEQPSQPRSLWMPGAGVSTQAISWTRSCSFCSRERSSGSSGLIADYDATVTVAVSPQHSTSSVLARDVLTIFTLSSVAVASEKNVANAPTPTAPPTITLSAIVLLPS